MTDYDSQIVELQAKVAAKKAKISRAERPTWKTNCSLPFNPPRNLQTVATVSECVELFSRILQSQMSHEVANETLGTSEKFEFGGYSISDWTEDFKTRIAMISLVQEKQKLRKFEESLEALESSDLKRKKALENIAKELAD